MSYKSEFIPSLQRLEPMHDKLVIIMDLSREETLIDPSLIDLRDPMTRSDKAALRELLEGITRNGWTRDKPARKRCFCFKLNF